MLRRNPIWFLLALFLLISLACSSATPTPKAPATKSNQGASVTEAQPANEATAAPKVSEAPPTATSTPKPTIGKVGEQVESAGIALTVLNVQKMKSAGLITAKEGNVLVDIEVVLENIDRDDKAPYNPFYFKVKDADGYEYNVSLGSLDPSLQSGDLSKGERVRGHVAFEVPESATGLVVSYEPMVLFGGYEPLKVNLEEMSENPVDIGEAQATAPAGKVGERVESAGIAFIVLNVQKVRSAGFVSAEAGNILVDIEVVIQNASRDETTPYNPFYFKLKDSQSFEYNPTMSAIEPSLMSGELEKGDVVRGHVTFEAPEKATGLIVTYEPEVLFGGYQPIRVNLDEKADKAADIPAPLSFPENKIGAPAESAGVTLTVLSAKKVKSVSGMPAKSGYTYMDIEVEIANTGRSDPSPYNPLYFKVRDSKGYEYGTSFASVDPSLTSGELAQGEKVRGHVTFEIPSQATGLLVMYEPEVLFGGYRIIRIDLGQ
jgi:Domain of unknown function (DUF4352)